MSLLNPDSCTLYRLLKPIEFIYSDLEEAKRERYIGYTNWRLEPGNIIYIIAIHGGSYGRTNNFKIIEFMFKRTHGYVPFAKQNFPYWLEEV